MSLSFGWYRIPTLKEREQAELRALPHEVLREIVRRYERGDEGIYWVYDLDAGTVEVGSKP